VPERRFSVFNENSITKLPVDVAQWSSRLRTEQMLVSSNPGQFLGLIHSNAIHINSYCVQYWISQRLKLQFEKTINLRS
jgi:hypothetical protein